MRARKIDVAKVRDALEQHLKEIDALLSRKSSRRARALALPGTPAVIVGSKLYRGPLKPEHLRKAVEEARRRG